MFVKPREGYTIRYPDAPSRVLPPEGGNVPDIQYWHQRLRDGDVVAADPPSEPEVPARAADQSHQE